MLSRFCILIDKNQTKKRTANNGSQRVILLERFLGGVRGERFFSKKVPPQSFFQ